jgi:NAD(P)-dependent dehydrogenase (short-subunit alcohol dehydrogenase family)
MMERGTGRIINVSSVIGEMGNIGQVNHAASKSGLFGLTKSLAREAIFHLGKAGRPPGEGAGVTVNAVTPGFVETDMVAGMPGKALDRVRAQIPMGRLGQPEEVAGVVAVLAADDSAYITGRQRRTGYVTGPRRAGGRYGLVMMCIGGGQGIAVTFERR